jgi:hypothetical protein
MEMVLGDPGRIEPALLGVHDLLRRQPVSFRGTCQIEQPSEEAQSLQICETFHDHLGPDRQRHEFARRTQASQIKAGSCFLPGNELLKANSSRTRACQ